MALYHSVKGSVNYTVVGSPTIVDGVVTDLTYQNYLQINGTPDFTQPFTVRIKFTTKGIHSENWSSYHLVIGNQKYFFGPRYDNKISLQLNKGATSYVSNTAVGLNKTYIVEYRYNAEKTFSIYIDSGNGLQFDSSFENVELPAISSSDQIQLGHWSYRASTGPQSVDLNETYITSNGQPWFGVCPVEVKKHQLMGPVGYTKVGSPTIVDGVASGFSANNYLSLPSTLDTTKNWEFVCKFKNETSRYKSVILGTTPLYGIQLSISYGTRFFIFMSSNGSSWNMVNGAYGTSASMSLGNTYYLKLTYSTSEGYKLYLSSDGIDWTLNYSYSGTGALYNTNNLTLGKSDSGDYLGGSIYLNETYIKVNGDLWFYQPQETKYIIRENPTTQEQHLVYAKPNMYLAGPVNYSVVGSPTIEDCDLTVFGAGNYIELPSINLFSKNSFEYVITLQIGDNYPKGILIEFPFDEAGGTSIAGGLYIWGNAGQGTISGGISSSDTNIEAYPVLSLNTKYAFRFKKESGVFTTAWRANDGAWQQLTTDNGANKTTNSTSRPIHIGLLSAITGVRFLLNETYCMTNDTLWFYGKNYSSKNIAPVPSGFTYGTTTTNAIGWVDMRTQAFTAAPTGATLGRDE